LPQRARQMLGSFFSLNLCLTANSGCPTFSFRLSLYLTENMHIRSSSLAQTTQRTRCDSRALLLDLLHQSFLYS
jgi:hypothetical protein